VRHSELSKHPCSLAPGRGPGGSGRAGHIVGEGVAARRLVPRSRDERRARPLIAINRRASRFSRVQEPGFWGKRGCKVARQQHPWLASLPPVWEDERLGSPLNNMVLPQRSTPVEATVPPLGLWAAIANVKKVCHKGPSGEEEHNGTTHFRGGARVYVIDAFWGLCNAVTVIGQHRKSRKWMCLNMPARHIENLRLKLVYSPGVQALMREHYVASGRTEIPGREYAEDICKKVPRWHAGPAEPAAAPDGGA